MAGHERLVAVKFVAWLDWQTGSDVFLLGAAYRLADWRPGSKLQRLLVSEVNTTSWLPGAVRLISRQTQGRSHSKVFAGQSDPVDRSRFTIAYTIEGAPGIVQGQLNDDDSVSLKVLDGPATLEVVMPR